MNHSFTLNLSCPIINADRCQLQRYIQSDIMLHCSSPVVTRLKSRASSIPGELILRASVWLLARNYPMCENARDRNAARIAFFGSLSKLNAVARLRAEMVLDA